MPKHLAVHVVILAGLIVAVTFLIFQSRALTLRLQALETTSVRVDSSPPAPDSRPPRGAPLSAGELQLPRETPEPPVAREADPAKAPTPSAPLSTLPAEKTWISSDLEQSVARHVDRILAEKYGHLPKAKTEDLEKVLERELNLTPSQKERISALLKKKREESNTVFSGKNPFSGNVLQKAMELDAKYETAIKNELDATQQAKYDQLKKDGKINSGIMIQIEANGDGE